MIFKKPISIVDITLHFGKFKKLEKLFGMQNLEERLAEWFNKEKINKFLKMYNDYKRTHHVRMVRK